MSEQEQVSGEGQQGDGQGQTPAAFEAWVRGVARLAAEHGLQAVVVAAVVPAAGGFGPSGVHALSWTHGAPPAEWRKGVAEPLAGVAMRAAMALVPAETASAAAPEGEDAPAAKAEG